MRRVLGSWVAALAILAAGLSSARAQETKVRLITDYPMYKKGSAKGVTFTLKNEGAAVVVLVETDPWSIWKDGQVFYVPETYMNPSFLWPGESKSWTWDLKKEVGGYAANGSYTIQVVFRIGSSKLFARRTIAVTKSGSLGTSLFPLSVGNEWTYVSGPGLGGAASAVPKMQVTKEESSWYFVKHLLGADRFARYYGAAYPNLSVLYGDGSPALFKFKRPKAYSYKGLVGPLEKTVLRVGETSDTLKTPMGTFQKCYRLDVLSATPTGYKAFWFAAGVGMVGYDKNTPNGIVAYRLHTAKVKGSDGKAYTIAAAEVTP